MALTRTSRMSQSRIATLLTVGFLMLGTGGTLAFAGMHGAGGFAASASFDQYRPPCVHGKGLGVPNECPGEKPEPPPCVHGKGLGVPNECPGEKPEKGGKGGKHGGHKGHKGGHRGKHKGAHKGKHKNTRKSSHSRH